MNKGSLLTRRTVLLFTTLSILALNSTDTQVIQARDNQEVTYSQSKTIEELRAELGFSESVGSEQDEESQKEKDSQETESKATESKATESKATESKATESKATESKEEQDVSEYESSSNNTLQGEGVAPSLVTIREGASIFETLGLESTSVFSGESTELATDTRIMGVDGQVYYRVYSLEGYKLGYILEGDIETLTALSDEQSKELQLAIDEIHTRNGIGTVQEDDSNTEDNTVDITNYEETDYYYVRTKKDAIIFSDAGLSDALKGLSRRTIYQVRGEFKQEGVTYLEVYESDELIGYVSEDTVYQSESPEYYEVNIRDIEEDNRQYIKLKDGAVVYRNKNIRTHQTNEDKLNSDAFLVKKNLRTRGLSYHGLYNNDEFVGYVDSRDVVKVNPYGETQDVEMNRKYTNHEEYLSMLVDYSGYAKENNIFPSVMMAQAMHESYTDGSSGLALSNKNMFGIKGQYNGQSTVWTTGEHTDTGSEYTINASFRSYPSYLEGIQDYVRLLNNERYTRYGVPQASTPKEQVQAIKDAGYATDVEYVQKVMNIIDKYNLTQYDK